MKVKTREGWRFFIFWILVKAENSNERKKKQIWKRFEIKVHDLHNTVCTNWICIRSPATWWVWVKLKGTRTEDYLSDQCCNNHRSVWSIYLYFILLSFPCFPVMADSFSKQAYFLQNRDRRPLFQHGKEKDHNSFLFVPISKPIVC